MAHTWSYGPGVGTDGQYHNSGYNFGPESGFRRPRHARGLNSVGTQSTTLLAEQPHSILGTGAPARPRASKSSTADVGSGREGQGRQPKDFAPVTGQPHEPARPNPHWILSIIVSIAFFPVGLVALLFSYLSNDRFEGDNVAEAKRYARYARNCSIGLIAVEAVIFALVVVWIVVVSTVVAHNVDGLEPVHHTTQHGVVPVS